MHPGTEHSADGDTRDRSGDRADDEVAHPVVVVAVPEAEEHTDEPACGPEERGASERSYQLSLPLVRHISEELERQMDPGATHPLHRKVHFTQPSRGRPQPVLHVRGQVQGDEQPHGRSASRPPRR